MTHVQLPPSVLLLLAAPAAAILAGAALIKKRLTHWPILISCAVVAACAAALAADAYAGKGLDAPVWTWMLTERWGIPFGMRIDGIGAAVLAMASFVGGLIHVYAVGYMKEEPGMPRFFLYFHLFFLGMIGLLVSNNLVQMYLFWELMGAASFLLIGFWAHKESARKASLQAFLVNRVGDFGFMLAALLMAARFNGNTRFYIFPQMAAAMPGEELALVGWLLFFAATAKSAQFPLYFWLPDAMEGPTPVSALMHAATMVTAGIFLLVRCWPLLAGVPYLPETIAVVGAFTAVFSAVIAFTRTDLKRILAYSTVSHLGLMAMAIGLGQIGAGVFHLITHGFFKATLFLCAGNMAHAFHKSTISVSEVGGLRKDMKMTFWCFLAAALSATGMWPFAGFYSKDAIIDAALHHGPAWGAVGLLISFLSAFYMGRMLFLVFFGERKEQKHGHAHEAEPGLAAPVAFLALGAFVVGRLVHEHLPRMLNNGWSLEMGPVSLPEFNLSSALFSTAAALAGWGGSWLLARGGWDWEWRAAAVRLPVLEGWRLKLRPVKVETIFDTEFFWKPLMLWLAGRGWAFAQWTGTMFDKKFWDGLIEGTATASRALAEAGGRWASGAIGDSLWWLMTGATALLIAGVLR